MGDLGCLNPASAIPTPHLDQLATEGMRLLDAHSPSAVCTPTRYGLLTGRYAWRTRLKSGVLWGDSTALIDPETPALPSWLPAQGYRTGGVGKWHLGLGTGETTDYFSPLDPSPLDYGFDSFFGIPASLDMPPYVYIRDDRAEAPPTSSVPDSSHRRQGGGGFWRGGPAAPEFDHQDVLPRLAHEASAFIETSREETPTKPLFLYLALSAPHTPWVPTSPFHGQSQAGHYGNFVAQVDDVVGQVASTLDRLEMTENTLLIVTSDNGAHWPRADIDFWGHAANLQYRGQKADIWEGGHRVPFLCRWPGVTPKGSVRNDLFVLTDLFATLAAAAQAPLPPQAVAEDSLNMTPVLADLPLAEPIRGDAVHHSLHGAFALREGPWKLIPTRGSGGFTSPQSFEPPPGEPKGQLYNLALDPSESNNLYQQRPDLVARLTRLLAERQRTGFKRP